MQGAYPFDERRRQEGEEDLVVSGEAVPAADALGGALDHVRAGAIRLDEVEIGGREVAKRMAEVPRRGHRLQEDLGQEYRGSHVEIDAPSSELGHLGREQAEVEMRAAAERRRIAGGV